MHTTCTHRRRREIGKESHIIKTRAPVQRADVFFQKFQALVTAVLVSTRGAV